MNGIIIGAGIGGLSTAIAMNNHNINVKVYETAQQLTAKGAGILIPPNAMAVLKKYNLESHVMKSGVVIESIDIVDLKGKNISATKTSHENNGEFYQTVAIHRSELQDILLNALPENTLITNKHCIEVVSSPNESKAIFQDASEETGSFLIGADGIHSKVRNSIISDSKLRYSGQTCWRGISDIALSSKWLSRLTEIWGNGIRFGFVPVSDSKVYWYATKVAKKDGSDDFLSTKKLLLDIYQELLDPVKDIILNTPDSSIIRDDLSDLLPLKSWFRGSMVLIGDAAHATTPNLGQGGAQAIEDSWYLAEEINNCLSIPEALNKFQEIRKDKVKKIVDASWQVGKVTNLSNSLACSLRNTIFRLVPSSIMKKQTKFVYDVSF